MQGFCQLNASFATSFKNVCELTLITWLRLKHRWTYSLKNQNITEYFDSNSNSTWSGGCHPHPSIITLMSKKLLFQPYLYLTTKDQNMTINTPLSSNQIDCYNGSEYCNGNKSSHVASSGNNWETANCSISLNRNVVQVTFTGSLLATKAILEEMRMSSTFCWLYNKENQVKNQV